MRGLSLYRAQESFVLVFWKMLDKQRNWSTREWHGGATALAFADAANPCQDMFERGAS
jgi:hypothetical protein